MKTWTTATFDSRQVKPGMLFAAVEGEKADGRAFIPQAKAAGAAVIVEGRAALADFARDYRRSLHAVVVGVTGSAGKTTVKELTAAFLRTCRRPDGSPVCVHATAGNFNNDLGLPITILDCPEDADFLVVEMGTNHPGEIARLVSVAEPNVGLVSSIGTAHIEFFGTQDGIAREKGTLLAGLRGDAAHPSFAVLARENARYEALAAMSGAPVETVSRADAEAARFAAALAQTLPGEHNVSNALVAFGCARRFGATLDGCLAALDGFRLPGKRWNVAVVRGVTVVEDCYNANPSSMAVALDAFAAQFPEGRRFVLMGDMLELGAASATYHAAALEKALALGCDGVFTVGGTFAQAWASCPGEDAQARAFPDVAAARAALWPVLEPGDALLVKGSHGLHLERFAEAL